MMILDTLLLDSDKKIDVSRILNKTADLDTLSHWVDEAASLLPGNLEILGFRLSNQTLAGKDAEDAICNVLEHKKSITNTQFKRQTEMILLTSNIMVNRFQAISLADDKIEEISEVVYLDRIDAINFVYLDIQKEICIPSLDLSLDISDTIIDDIIVS